MIQLTTAQLINSTSGRVCNFGIFQRRQFLWNHQMTSHFSHYSRTENFLLVVRPNRRRFSFDSKGAPNFQKNVYWEIPKRCLISNSFSLLKLGPNSLCDQGTSIATLLDLTQEQNSIMKNYAVWKTRFTKNCQDFFAGL